MHHHQKRPLFPDKIEFKAESASFVLWVSMFSN